MNISGNNYLIQCFLKFSKLKFMDFWKFTVLTYAIEKKYMIFTLFF